MTDTHGMDFNIWKLRDFPLWTQNIPTLLINELPGLVRVSVLPESDGSSAAAEGFLSSYCASNQLSLLLLPVSTEDLSYWTAIPAISWSQLLTAQTSTWFTGWTTWGCREELVATRALGMQLKIGSGTSQLGWNHQARGWAGLSLSPSMML